MNWSEFQDEFGCISGEFNKQEFEQRVKVGAFMNYEAIKELLRMKEALRHEHNKQLKRIDDRITILKQDLIKFKKTFQP